MTRDYRIQRIFNNNVVLADESVSGQEMILQGKGIGFGAEKGHTLKADDSRIEKKFRLENEDQMSQYKLLINQVDRAAIGISEEIITLIPQEISPILNDHIHVALPDHIHFAVERIRNKLEIVNPFLHETKVLYPKEYALAEKAAEMITTAFQVHIPDSEIGFLTLHIHSAVSHIPVTKAIQHAQLISDLMAIIQDRLNIRLAKTSIEYDRLVTHIRFAIERIRESKTIRNPLLDKIKQTLVQEYDLARELADRISTKLELSVPEDEMGYFALHLYRLNPDQAIIE
jgi:transcriptional antiterminator